MKKQVRLVHGSPFRKVILPVVMTIFMTCGCSTGDPAPERRPSAKAVPLRCESFDLAEVTLLDGPFLDATRVNEQSLLRYEPDRLLAGFRAEAGLEPRAERYGGWEAMSLAGHSLGHHLSGCALMYRTTGDPRFLERVNYMVDELRLCQETNGKGYIGAFNGGQKILEEEVGKGKIEASAFYLNGIWAPFYTIHKIMAGLRDAYRLCDNETALTVWEGLADWLSPTLGSLNEEQVQEMLGCEHGGMNEVLADLYGITGNDAYLELSDLFYHRAILDPLSRGEDILSGKHGNTQIPKLIGLARRYELTGNKAERETARFFWERVVHHHSYANGSHGFHEYFGPPDSLSQRLGSSTSESCNVYNMLKLSEHLFCWSADPDVADFYEKALINHILSSQHPRTGQVLYFHSLQMGGVKEFQDPYDFTCCIGTGMENHSKYGEAIYFKSDRELFVNLFIASELHWKEKGIILRQETGFPGEEATRLMFLQEEPVKLTLQLRIPSWADDRCRVRVNGKEIRKKVVPGTYLSLKGNWTVGDEITLEVPFSLRTEAMPDNPQRMALLYGPLVLAGDLGQHAEGTSHHWPEVPLVVNGQSDPSHWLAPVPGDSNTFLLSTARPEPCILRPLYRITDHRYTVYWDQVDEQGYERLLQDEREKEQEMARIESLTIDKVVAAWSPDSQDHNFRSVNPGFYSFDGLPCIESRYGWFSFDLKVEKGDPATLMVDYWGGFRGPREFRIKADQVIIATEDLSAVPYNEMGQRTYLLPDSLTARGLVTITFEATDGHYAGPVFGLRTLRAEAPLSEQQGSQL